MTVTGTCPHGFAPGTCEICRVMGGGSGPATPTRRPDATSAGTPARRRGGTSLRIGTAAVVGLVAVIAAVQALAVLSAVLRVAQIVAVAALAGWLGWTLGVAHGRRSR